MDHEGVIRAQTHVHASSKEGGEGVAVVVQEQAVVGQRTHAQPYLDGAIIEVVYTPMWWTKKTACISKHCLS